MASVEQLTEDIHLLVHVCRLLAGKATDPELGDELVDLADSLDYKIDRLREAIAKLIT